MAEQRPQLRIIAGPKGSGKTTFVREFLPRYAPVPRFVNADLIASGLSPFAPELSALRAGRLMLEEIQRLAADRLDFAFETTLAGRTYETMLREFRQQGYVIYLYFLWLPDVAMNLRRVAHRVQEGGHHVPDDDVRRRYRRGISNFLTVYRSLADFWILFENSGTWPREFAFARGGAETILDSETYRLFTQAGTGP